MKLVTLRSAPLFPVALVLSMTLGLVVGTAFPQRAEASNFWEFWHDIAVGSSTQNVNLICGWHGECPDEGATAGTALDWDDTNGTAYFAGAAKWDSWYVENAAYADVADAPTIDCSRVRARLRNWWNNSLLATEYYTHVDNPSSDITVYAYSSPYTVREPVGDVVDPEPDDDCAWTGPHVHQYGSGWDATNSGGFNSGVDECNLFEGSSWTDCDNPHSNATWVHYENWTY